MDWPHPFRRTPLRDPVMEALTAIERRLSVDEAAGAMKALAAAAKVSSDQFCRTITALSLAMRDKSQS